MGDDMIKYICTTKEYPTKESGTLKVTLKTGEEVLVKYLVNDQEYQFYFDEKYKDVLNRSDLNFMKEYILNVIYKRLDGNLDNDLNGKGVE